MLGALQPGSDLPKERADSHEDQGKSQDEQPDTGEHAATLLLLEIHPGKTCHVSQVPRDEGQHAGGGKGHQSCEDGYGHSQQQRPGEDGFGKRVICCCRNRNGRIDGDGMGKDKVH